MKKMNSYPMDRTQIHTPTPSQNEIIECGKEVWCTL